MGFGVWGLGFGVWGSGFRVQGLGLRVAIWSLAMGPSLAKPLKRVFRSSGFRFFTVWGLQGLGFRVSSFRADAHTSEPLKQVKEPP